MTGPGFVQAGLPGTGYRRGMKGWVVGVGSPRAELYAPPDPTLPPVRLGEAGVWATKAQAKQAMSSRRTSEGRRMSVGDLRFLEVRAAEQLAGIAPMVPPSDWRSSYD